MFLSLHSPGSLSLSLSLFLFFWFFETGFLCIALAVLELTFVDQAGLELRNPPASASQVLGLKVCAINARRSFAFLTLLRIPCLESDASGAVPRR